MARISQKIWKIRPAFQTPSNSTRRQMRDSPFTSKFICFWSDLNKPCAFWLCCWQCHKPFLLGWIISWPRVPCRWLFWQVWKCRRGFGPICESSVPNAPSQDAMETFVLCQILALCETIVPLMPSPAGGCRLFGFVHSSAFLGIKKGRICQLDHCCQDFFLACCF